LQGAKINATTLLAANLQSADLREAGFRGAKFEGAEINHANLQGADLTGAKRLTVDMLLEAASLYQLKGLDPKIKKELRKKNPGLFLEPEE
jgi:uncharacterized protein YjbI with pentapeptide repeats